MKLTRRWVQRVQHFTNSYITESYHNYYKPSLKSQKSTWNAKFKVIQSQLQRKIKRVLNDDTRCHDEACTWHHSALSSLAGVVSHSTDQPGGKIHGQVKLAIWSSNESPENKVEPQARLSILILSKAYPTMGILSPLPRHAKLLTEGVCFCRKAIKSKSLFSDFSFQVLVWLTILH